MVFKVIKLIEMTALMMILCAISFTAEKKFVVGVENISYYPQYSTEKGNYTGYAREILDLFAKSKGYTFEYKPLPLNRLFDEFVDGNVDFKYPDNEYWATDIKKGKEIKYSNAVVDYIDGIVVKPENKGKGLKNLKTISIVLGFTAWEYLDAVNKGTIKIYENPDYSKMLEMAIIDRVDGAYSNIAVAKYQLTEVLKKPGALVFDPSLPHTKSSYYMSSIKYPNVIDEFNKFLETEKGSVKKMKGKYKVEEGIDVK